MIIIRFNPDNYKHNGQTMQTPWADRLPFLLEIIRAELVRVHERFCVEVIQLYFDITGDYSPIQREDITDRVAV